MASANRRVLQRVARCLAKQRPPESASDEVQGMWEDCVLAVATALSEETSNFDRGRFVSACGL